MKTTPGKSLALSLCAIVLISFALTPVAEARERGEAGGGGGADRSAARSGGGERSAGAAQNRAQINNSKRDTRTNNVRNTSVNNVNASRNVNVNRSVNIEGDHHGGCCNDWDDDDHPVAAVAAVAVTAAAIGSIVRTPPANCVPVNQGGVVYQQCGSTWYQPQYVGSQVQYVVVNPPY